MSERTTIELSSDIAALPGQDVTIEEVLDKKFEAFSPDSFLFDDPLDWIVTSFEATDTSNSRRVCPRRTCGSRCFTVDDAR
jgi:hypothetical protein